ncbi:MAG: LysM peptidoglycan-binding domain-containing protein [Chloroflexi bacterium]|nr:LysM peptidoglycan-binding domain-containing protein [Chloroflexota bacterium]
MRFLRIRRLHLMLVMVVLALTFVLSGATAAFAAPQDAPQADKHGGVCVFYRAQHGDTLWSLAWRYHTTVNAIASASGLYNANYIRAGMVLCIPSGYVRPPGKGDGYGGYQGVHVVRYGETLSWIALRYRTSVYHLMQLNHIKNPNWIWAGQVLRVA